MFVAIVLGLAISLTIIGGVVLSALRVQEAAWRRIARQRRARWEEQKWGDDREFLSF